MRKVPPFTLFELTNRCHPSQQTGATLHIVCIRSHKNGTAFRANNVKSGTYDHRHREEWHLSNLY